MLACTTPPTLSLLELDRPYGGADTSSDLLEEKRRICKCVSAREKGERWVCDKERDVREK